jgi:hypothetical protein
MRNMQFRSEEEEDKKILKSYKKIYKINYWITPIYFVEDFVFGLIAKLVSFCKKQLCSYVERKTTRYRKRSTPLYKDIASSTFAKDFSKEDPVIAKLLTIDPTKQRIYQTREVQNLACTIKDMTDGKYDKNEFKGDLFGHLLKNNKKDLNIA